MAATPTSARPKDPSPQALSSPPPSMPLLPSPPLSHMDALTPTASPSPLPLPPLCSSSLNAYREIWTNICVSTLLDEYEKVFIKLGRGHLRYQDWEIVCHEVNRRIEGSPLTPEQCKAKIESLKKHYRRERLKCSNSPSRVSRWVFYNKVREMVGDAFSHGDGSAVGNAEKSCNGNDRRPMASSDNGPKGWDMDAADRLGFRKELPEKMVLDKTEVQVRMSEGLNSGHTRARWGEGEGSAKGPANHGVDRPANGQLYDDNLTSATEGDHKKSVEGAAEAVDPSKSQTEKFMKKSSTKNRDLASLGKDLKEGLSSFAAVIEKIERTKMELIMVLQKQRLEQDRHHAEMEVERTRLLMKSQLALAKLICASMRKDCNDCEGDQKCSKKGRWDAVIDVASCWTENGEKKAEDMATEAEQIDEHETRPGNNGGFDNQTFPGLERDVQNEDQNFT